MRAGRKATLLGSKVNSVVGELYGDPGSDTCGKRSKENRGVESLCWTPKVVEHWMLTLLKKRKKKKREERGAEGRGGEGRETRNRIL